MIHVAFNSDDNFKDKILVVMQSIMTNTKEEVTFHVIGTVINDKRFNIKCYKAPSLSSLPFVKSVGEITLAAGYRLLLPNILTDLDKVIYLDGDILVRKDIADLYKLEPRYLAGVVDPMWKSQGQKVGIIKGAYINSGVMLLNLENLRKLNFVEKVQNFPYEHYNITLPDQDAINIVMEGLIEYLPYTWNVYNNVYPESTSSMLKVRENPAIVHYCGPQKPWKSCDVIFKQEWLKYKHLTK